MGMMRRLLISLALLGGAAAPAAAQQPQVERRVDRLEQEMRAVQRRVFPGGAQATIDPELQARPATPAPGVGSSNAINALTSRVEALEAQLARITGQVEENGFQIRQLEEQVAQLRRETQAQIERLQQAAQPPAPPPASAQPADPAADELAGGNDGGQPPQSPPSRAATDAAEEAYNIGFRLWEQRRYADAQRALTGAADAHPRSRWASWSRNLAGRAYLDDGKPATAARIFLQNYQSNPRGERAADSLFFLGEALVRLNRRAEACPVYDELEATFPNMRDYLRSRLPAARQAARCAPTSTATN
jgi:TolA-binding protein